MTLTELMDNDFAVPIERAYPEVRDVREKLERAGAVLAMLSGSGSCVFGLFAEHATADDCAERLAESGYWTYSTKMLHSMPCAVQRDDRSDAGGADGSED